MSILNIRPAKRELAKLVIGLSGPSGSGKTYTALKIAQGMVRGDTSKIGLLDTENKRGSLYADMFYPDQFMVGDLDPPFSPARYIQAINEFEKSGIEVLIIDSISHEWEGEGGCAEMAEGSKTGWLVPKQQHKKFVNCLLQSKMHIIACTRAREKVKVVKQGGKTVYEDQGIQAICEKNFMFEMTCSMMMDNSGQEQRILKSCEGLGLEDEHKGYLGEAVGERLIDWVEGVIKAQDDEVEEAIKSLTETKSLDELKERWTGLPPAIRKKIGADLLNAQKKRLGANGDTL